MRHTPGPLYAIPNPQWRGATWAIATDPNADWARYDHIAHVVGEGNARLFAAAPDLLDLCEAQLESIKMMVATLIKITHSPLDDPTIVDLYEAMREAEAIIAKAKGEEGLV